MGGVWLNIWPTMWNPFVREKEEADQELNRLMTNEPSSIFRLISYGLNSKGYCDPKQEIIH